MSKNLTSGMLCVWCQMEEKPSGTGVLASDVPGWGWIAICEAHRRAWEDKHLSKSEEN